MFKKILFSAIIFYFLALLQASFLPHFSVFGIVPNIVLFFVFLINLFEKNERTTGLIAAFAAGLFLDIFSGGFIGFYILISLAISILVKYVLREHIKIPALG